MNWKKINILRRLFRVSISKTLYFNFAKLPMRQAIKLPFLISRNTYFFDLSGKVILEGEARFAMVRFGFFGEDTKVWKDGRNLLKIQGTLVFKGSSHYGTGIIFRVEPNATLSIGDNVRISNDAKIICYKHIQIGSNCRIAWECQLIDTTFHYIKSIETGEINERHGAIIIGNNNWIGNRAAIMKGTVTPDYCIIAGGSMCNKVYEKSYSLLAGTPAKLVKENVYRVLDAEEAMIDNDLLTSN
jgi:acetyltransferase-like isoleucine patch superfamily enzyme